MSASIFRRASQRWDRGKKKNTKVLTPTQLAAITKAGDSLKSYLTERARAYVLGSSCRGLSLCASALERDGYLNAASGEITGSAEAAADSNTASTETTGSAQAAAESNIASGETTGSAQAVAESSTASGETTGSAQAAAESFSGALTKEHLEDALMPAQLYSHKLWANLRTHFADWGEQARCAIQIMCALLSITKAWTVLDQVAPNLELDAVALVGPALLNLGADSDFIAEFGKRSYLTTTSRCLKKKLQR